MSGAPPPVIPPPPRIVRRRTPGGDHRWLGLVWALALGVGLGVSLYMWLAPVTRYFDYWVARALG